MQSPVCAVAAALLFVAAAQAAPGEEHWAPYSRTAESITGAITLSPSRLAMAGGKSLPLAVLSDVKGFKAGQGIVDARILRVTEPADPVLLNGNTLCGKPVRWLAVWHQRAVAGPGTLLGMAAFSGDKPPASEDEPGLCGDFFYERAR